MKKIILAGIVVFVVLGFVSAGNSEITNEIRYNGRLKGYTVPLSGKERKLRFEYFNAETAGMSLYYEDHKVTPNGDGVFSVVLEPEIEWQKHKDIWLELSIDGKAMTPREKIMTQPYAQHAKTADSAENAERAKTAENADNAKMAENATNADNAQHSKTADTATTAANAQHAKTADTATTATTATNADNATNAQHAKTTDRANNGVPVGTVIAFAGNGAPSGYLPCDGKEVNQSEYPDLFAVIGSLYGSAGGGKFRLPNFQGMFLRGAGSQTINVSNKGSDPNQNKTNITVTANPLGQVQGDAIRNIVGTAGSANNTYAYFSRSSGVFALEGGANHQTNGGGGSSRNGINFDASRIVPTSMENRPANYAVNYYIKY
ncbi:MAG: phage tail protein [Endomicrobium sp.]|jgi:hypothetical protein|nr:phage tail protein [Endomicrobium sp.]